MNTETLQKVAETVLAEPVRVTVDIKPKNHWHRKAQAWGWMPKKKEFPITPICLATLLRISKILLTIDIRLHQDQHKLLNEIYQAIDRHAEKMAMIVALAIRNSDGPVDANLVAFILRNFTAKEIMTVLSVVVKQMDVSSFLSSIISIRGLNVLDTQEIASAEPVNESEVSL